MSQVFFRAIACGLAGLVAWVVTEPFNERFIPIDGAQNTGAGQTWLIFLVGALVGLTAGALHGIAKGSKRHAIESAVLGFIFGAIGSTIGIGIGGTLSSAVMDIPPGGIAYMEMPERMIARALALLPMGLLMGVAIGATLRSKRGVIAGLLGGTVGGLFVGFAFDLLAGTIANTLVSSGPTVEPPPGMMIEIGGPPRAVLAVGLGVAVGLFVAVFDRVTRQAWVRLVLGRNEGKEWPIDNERTLIGRDERAHVPLFGDMNVAPLHAIIFRQGSQYVIQDQGTSIGIGHNGVRVPNAALSPGDTFQVGSHNLQFLMKASAAQKMQEGRQYAVMQGSQQQYQPVQQIQQPQQPQQPQPTPGATGVAGTASDTGAQQHRGFAAIGGGDPSQQAQQPMALVATSGPLSGQRFDLSKQIEAGREAAGIALAGDPQASRHHAAFEPFGGAVHLQDLGSTNGTFVNGQKVERAMLRRGDVVQIGASTFRVE